MEDSESARRSTRAEEERLSTVRRYAPFFPSSRDQPAHLEDQADPSPSTSSVLRASIASPGSGRREDKRQRQADGATSRHRDGGSSTGREAKKKRQRQADGATSRHRDGGSSSTGREAKRARNLSRRSARRRRETAHSSSSERSPSPSPPPAFTSPIWCWGCQVRQARPVEEPVRHLCLCLPCSDGGTMACPLCNAMIWAEILNSSGGQQDAMEQRNLFFRMLRRTALWHQHYAPPSIPFDGRTVDGSDSRALPLVHVQERCEDCTTPKLPAVWISSCCQCVLCPACLVPGMRRRHGPCRRPGVLGLLRNARATFQFQSVEGDPATFYLWRQVRILLRIRRGSDLISGDGSRYILRYYVSLADIHRRCHRPARRQVVLYMEVVNDDGHAVLQQLTKD